MTAVKKMVTQLAYRQGVGDDIALAVAELLTNGVDVSHVIHVLELISKQSITIELVPQNDPPSVDADLVVTIAGVESRAKLRDIHITFPNAKTF